jgi:hypothetical protein
MSRISTVQNSRKERAAPTPTTFEGKVSHKTARFVQLEVALLVLTRIILGHLKAHVLSRGGLGKLPVDTRSGGLRNRNVNDGTTSLAVEVARAGHVIRCTPRNKVSAERRFIGTTIKRLLPIDQRHIIVLRCIVDRLALHKSPRDIENCPRMLLISM